MTPKSVNTTLTLITIDEFCQILDYYIHVIELHSMHSFAFGLFCSILHLRGSSVSLYVLNLFILLLSNYIIWIYHNLLIFMLIWVWSS